MAKHKLEDCIQGPTILLINKDVQMINEKLDSLIADRKEQQQKREEFETRMFAKLDEHGKRFVPKTWLYVVGATLSATLAIVSVVWQIIQFSQGKF